MKAAPALLLCATLTCSGQIALRTGTISSHIDGSSVSPSWVLVCVERDADVTLTASNNVALSVLCKTNADVALLARATNQLTFRASAGVEYLLMADAPCELFYSLSNPLSISAENLGKTLSLRWRGAGYRLQSSGLTSDHWNDCPAPLSTNVGIVSATVQPTNRAQFFRLK